MLLLGLGLGLGLAELLTQWKEVDGLFYYESLCIFLDGFNAQNMYLATRLTNMICLSGMNLLTGYLIG